ncbi:MAG: hypothetical protein NTW65_03785 [Deltaproteobacteria bacterium]|nr:hypothetical protein [Deltaproteobacteria bacterium]
MDKTEITKQLELYSNAIIAFIVFQSLAFCYHFGTSDKFNSIVKASKELSVGLTIMFSVALILAFFANRYICLKLEELSGEYGQLVKAICWGKAVVIILFGALPIYVTVRYAMFNA